VIERKKIAITWHYRRADPELGKYQAQECKRHLENTVAKKWDVEVMPGKANIEVRPKFVNKGEIAKRLVEAYGSDAESAPELVLCLGDDTTDEGECSLIKCTDQKLMMLQTCSDRCRTLHSLQRMSSLSLSVQARRKRWLTGMF